MHGRTPRMDHWRLSLQRIQCGINFMSKIFIPTAKLAKAFHHRFCLPYTQYLKLLEDIRSNKLFNRWCGYKRNNKKCLQWIYSFLVCFATLVVVGLSMTVKSPLPLIRRFTECFLCFPCVWQYFSLQKMGVNTG